MTDPRPLNPTRRSFIVQAAALGAVATTTATARAADLPKPAEPVPPRAPFAAAVMRTPVIVPESIDAFPAVRARNTEAMVAAIEAAMKAPNPPRLIVFPVLQLVSALRNVSGIPIDMVAIDLLEKPLDQTVFAPIVAACRRHNCYVATSTQEKSGRLPGRYFHTGFVMGPEGLVLRSPKTQAKSAPEISYIRDLKAAYVAAYGPESILPVAKTPLGTIGCFIEAEAEVLDAARTLAHRGAEIIVHPSLEEDETPWAAIKQALAYQCQVYLLTGATARNLLSKDPQGGWKGGASTIIAPDGRLLASLGGHDTGAATAMLDLAEVAEARAKNADKTTPAPALYGTCRV